MKKIIKLFIALIILLPLLYTAAWFGTAHIVTKELKQLENHKSVQFSPAPSKVSGFPKWPSIYYSGKIKTSKATINVKDMVVSLSATPASIRTKVNAPKGFKLTDHITKKTQIFSASHLTVKIPTSPIPKNGKKSGLSQWRDDGGKIIISSLKIEKDDVKIKGAGTITLDQALQPQGTIDLKIEGYQNLLTQLSSAGIIKNIPTEKLKIANSLLGALTGKKKSVQAPSSFNAPLVIKNRKIHIGPMRVAKMPKMNWPE